MALISILTPFKNSEKYIQYFIESVINQTFFDWELILVNDFSNDSSEKILSKYQSDNRIKLFQNQENGIINALRTAYKNCSGQYITRMDSDDIMALNKLELLYTVLLKKGNGFVATGLVEYFPTENVSDGYKKYEKWLNKLTHKELNFNEVYKECVVASPNFLISRYDLDKIGAFNYDFYPEDYDLVFRMYKNKMKIASVQNVTHFWRHHPERTSLNDKRYSTQYFQTLKTEYFLEIDYIPSKKIALWGVGEKAKMMAETLITNNIAFEWFSENDLKINQKIYGINLQNIRNLADFHNYQHVLTVNNKNIIKFLTEKRLKNNLDFFQFS